AHLPRTGADRFLALFHLSLDFPSWTVPALQIPFEAVSLFERMFHRNAELGPLSRKERNAPNLLGTPDVLAPQLALQASTEVDVPLRSGSDFFLEINQALVQARESSELAAHFNPRFLALLILRPRRAQFDEFLKRNAGIAQTQDPPPHQRWTG